MNILDPECRGRRKERFIYYNSWDEERERERRAGSEVERSGREEVHHTEQQVELMETLGVYTREEKQPA